MKILKQLNKFFLFTFLLINPVSANEPVDIWNIEKKDTEENEILIENTNDDENKIIQGIKIEQQNEKILVNNALGASEIKLAGLYDPEENGLSIDMWSNSNGEDIKYVLDNITTKELSKFSEKVLEIALLTNSYIPNNNISPNILKKYDLTIVLTDHDYLNYKMIMSYSKLIIDTRNVFEGINNQKILRM